MGYTEEQSQSFVAASLSWVLVWGFWSVETVIFLYIYVIQSIVYTARLFQLPTSYKIT
jgi:hypothetical protein